MKEEDEFFHSRPSGRTLRKAGGDGAILIVAQHDLQKSRVIATGLLRTTQTTCYDGKVSNRPQNWADNDGLKRTMWRTTGDDKYSVALFGPMRSR